MDRVIALLILSFALCIAMSVLGGLSAALIKFRASADIDGPEFFFNLALLRRNLPLVFVEILSRIPINVIDRLVSVFCAYGIAVLFRKLLAK
jgi:hypothetical protein